jgi:hypothetical protein
MSRKWTSIAISHDLKYELDGVGFRKESYEKIIKRLLSFYLLHSSVIKKESKKEESGNGNDMT